MQIRNVSINRFGANKLGCVVWSEGGGIGKVTYGYNKQSRRSRGLQTENRTSHFGRLQDENGKKFSGSDFSWANCNCSLLLLPAMFLQVGGRRLKQRLLLHLLLGTTTADKYLLRHSLFDTVVSCFHFVH